MSTLRKDRVFLQGKKKPASIKPKANDLDTSGEVGDIIQTVILTNRATTKHPPSLLGLRVKNIDQVY